VAVFLFEDPRCDARRNAANIVKLPGVIEEKD